MAWLLHVERSAAAVLYVSNSSAGGSGSLNDPMSLHECFAILPSQGAGSACMMLAGEYKLNATAELRGLHGTLDAPYHIGAEVGHTVTLDGTRDVPGPWTWTAASHTYTDGSTADVSHWVADWPAGWAEPWQLFVDGEMQVVARWPNVRWDDRSFFDDTQWAHGNEHGSYGGPPAGAAGVECRLFDDGRSYTSSRSLAASGINASGMAIVLQIGNWYTHSGIVHRHTPGSTEIAYLAGDGWKIGHYSADTDMYYLEGALSLLDAETEWAYDQLTRKLHLLPRGGGSTDPNGIRVQARVQEYAIAMTDSSHVRVHGLRFFATTIYAAGENFGTRDLRNVRLDSLELVHP